MQSPIAHVLLSTECSDYIRNRNEKLVPHFEAKAQEFKQIFGRNLEDFLHPLVGFRYHPCYTGFIGRPPDGESYHDRTVQKYGDRAAILIQELIETTHLTDKR